MSFVWINVAFAEDLELNPEVVYIFYVITCEPLGCRDMPEQHSFVDADCFAHTVKALFRIYFIEGPKTIGVDCCSYGYFLMSTEFRTSHWAHREALQVELDNEFDTFLPLTVVVRRILSPKLMQFCGDYPTNSIVKTFLMAGWSWGEEVIA